jgi:chromosome segregation ATPase
MPPKEEHEVTTFTKKWTEIQGQFNSELLLFKFDGANFMFNPAPQQTAEDLKRYIDQINDLMKKYNKTTTETTTTDIFKDEGLYHMIMRFSLKNKQIELNNMLVQVYNTKKLGSEKELEELQAKILAATTTQTKLNADLEALKTSNTTEKTTNAELQKNITEVTKLKDASLTEIAALKTQLASANTVAAENKTNLEKSQKTSNDSITQLLTTLQSISFTPTKAA